MFLAHSFVLRSFPRPRRLAIPALLLALGSGCGASPGQEGEGGVEGTRRESLQERLPPPGEAWVIFGADTVGAEVARTPEQRERGLMFREALEEGRGMLFVFPDAQVRSFWMRDTFLPLDIAYMDESLIVVDIQGMEPQSEALHQSARAAMFALEVPLGWFAKKGIEVGAAARVIFGPS